MFLDRLLSKRFSSAHVRSRSGGWIPLMPAPQLAAANALLVGDAAGQVKPLSGGGLYTGGTCARVAGKEAARLSQAEEDADDVPGTYSDRCLEAIGREQTFGRSLRHHLARLRDTDVEAVAAALDDRPFLQFLADHADIDCFHKLPDQLASEPRLWATMLRIVPLLGSLTS
jgi:flavin-dependent dehydrogenase